MTITREDKSLVRNLANDQYGPLLDLSEADKTTLRDAVKDSKNVRIVDLIIAAHEHEIDDNTRALLKLRAEILQERTDNIMPDAMVVKE